MVLLIPATYKWIKEKGIAEGKAEGIVEGIAEGLAQGREAQRKRYKEALRRFGEEVDGKVVLTISPEVEAFLNGEDPDSE